MEKFCDTSIYKLHVGAYNPTTSKIVPVVADRHVVFKIPSYSYGVLRNKMSSHKKRIFLQPFDKTFAAGKVEIMAAQASCSIQTRNVRKTTEPQEFFYFVFFQHVQICSLSGLQMTEGVPAHPHMFFSSVLIGSERRGSCGDVLGSRAPMFIWWTLVAHPLSCGLTQELFLFSSVRWARQNHLSNRSKMIKRLFLALNRSSV